jgi:hypothetical protein
VGLVELFSEAVYFELHLAHVKGTSLRLLLHLFLLLLLFLRDVVMTVDVDLILRIKVSFLVPHTEIHDRHTTA